MKIESANRAALLDHLVALSTHTESLSQYLEGESQQEDDAIMATITALESAVETATMEIRMMMNKASR